MNAKKYALFGVAGLAVAAISAYAIVGTSKTFRTTGSFICVTQGSNQVTSNPQFDNLNLAGRNLVNLAMGRSVNDTNEPNQVMAMTFECDLSSASLVVYDRSTSNVVAVIAGSTSVDSVKQQDTNQTGPNRARFVAHLQILRNGNVAYGLLGGYLTIAGHVRLDPVTGCPEPVLVGLDFDPLDRLVGNKEIPNKVDPDVPGFSLRTGLAHLIGVLDVVNDSKTNTVLIPFGDLSIRRALPVTVPAD
jgi:hypothetical protein